MLVYDKVESLQRVECHLAGNLNESGTCKLILTTYAGDEGEDAKLGIYERVVSFVKFVEGPTVDDIAADKLSFEVPDALVGVPMDTELTFEITFGETLKTKGSKLVDA